MYGYSSMFFNPSEEERKKYLFYYCGICHSLKKYFGNIYRFTIVKEVVLFAMMQKDYTNNLTFRCPWMRYQKKQKPYNDDYLKDYAYLNVLLIYGKLIDYTQENTKIPKNVIIKIRNKMTEYYGEDFIKKYEIYLEEQNETEKKKADFDEYAYISSKIVSHIFERYFGNTESALPTAMGTIVYLIDAVEDFSKDRFFHKFNGINNSFETEKLENLQKEDKNRIIFTYDICTKEIIENIEAYSIYNKDFVKKILSFSFAHYRIYITEKIHLEDEKNGKRYTGNDKKRKIQGTLFKIPKQ